MALLIGTRIGQYEIVAPLGAGGMGEVYRARDAKLERAVALKILPESFAADPERIARFEREAKVLAGLNHPYIAHVHGFEESGDTRALVMELVEGEDLSQRIARGPIPLEEALPIARQIAEALEAAHEQGIVHRDLKPSNIKVSADGAVKVLDFGLAKAFDRDRPVDATNSPTLTVAATLAGVLLGTAAYMSPEQAKGKTVDKRTDIWAFGCVLFEMLTGTRAFDGEDVTETLAAVVRGEPDWNALPRDTPPAMRKLLRGCLQKDRRNRVPDIGVARLEITAVLDGPEDSAPSTAPPASGRAWKQVAIVTIAMAVAGLIAGWVVWRFASARTVSLPMQRFSLLASLPPPGEGATDTIALSRDGTRLVFVTMTPQRRFLSLRLLDQLEVRPLPGTEDAAAPFFSPDGEWVGFFATVPGTGSTRATLKRVAIRGGSSSLIASNVFTPAGASWGTDGNIVFAASESPGSGPAAPVTLFTVPATGGTARALAALGQNETARSWPQVLPDGKGILCSVRIGATYEHSQVAIFSPDSNSLRTVIEQGYHARYVPTGHIVYVLSGTLMAVPFDLSRLQVTGTPTPLIENIAIGLGRGNALFDVSETGILVYGRPGEDVRAPQRSMVWVDRAGREEPIPAPPRTYTYPRISPDGGRVALDIRDQESDLWTWDFRRQNFLRVTSHPSQDYYPVWTPDGQRLAFTSNRDGGIFNTYWQAADGTGEAVRLTTGAHSQAAYAFTPDGKRLLIRDDDPKTGDDLLAIVMNEARADSRSRLPPVEPVLQTTFREFNGELSPDGRWLAYQSNEAGRDEVYVRPFPKTDNSRAVISAGGGSRPVWSRDGRQLFYVKGVSPEPIQMMRVDSKTAAVFSASSPQLVFEGQYYADPRVSARGRTYDVAADGRFLMIKDVSSAPESPGQRSLVIVFNWQEQLKQR